MPGVQHIVLSGHFKNLLIFKMKFDFRDVVIYAKVLYLDIVFCCFQYL